MKKWRRHFRPEFLNRIDEMIIFRPLSNEDIKAIVDIQLRSVEGRLTERKIRIELTDAAKKALARSGWDPTFGARPLKRAIQRHLLNPLAVKTLSGEIREGEMIHIDANPEGNEPLLQFAHAAEVVGS